MSEFLETLKVRMADAQKRLLITQQKFQSVQIEHQAAMQEFSSWQNAVQAEARREQQQIEGGAILADGSVQALALANGPSSNAPGTQTNQTDAVRQLLRQHPEGMTPDAMWQQLKNQIPRRPYIYSVLKRLKDRDDAFVRRGKYFLKVTSKNEDSKEQHSVVH